MEMSIREVRQQLANLPSVLGKTPEIIITRRGTPLARLTSIGKPRQRPTHAKLRAMQTKAKVNSEVLIRADRDER